MTMATDKPPPSASAFLQKHTHASNEGDESSGVGSKVSGLIGGLVGVGVGGAPPGQTDDDDRSVSSMKHRQGSDSRSYDKRLPKTYDGGGGDDNCGGAAGEPSRSTPARPVGPLLFANLRSGLRGLFSPRATDIQQLILKLETQFHMLDIDVGKYAIEKEGPEVWDALKNDSERNEAVKRHRQDRKHPLNNPKLMTEVHFVGRQALDSTAIALSTLLISRDRFGSVMELWLNDNLISDDGAAAIAGFLQLPTCALTELWLGNNQIGPTGTALIAGALSNSDTSQLKCLGLYKNPIGNGGASTLAQMLRRNHTLSTLDVHGCGSRGKKGPEVLEGYGCRVTTANDGTEYIARVVASISDDKEGVVTDQRFLDAVNMFVAFNRLNPTREQAIRGIMSSNTQGETDGDEDGNEVQYKLEVSKLLSDLSNKPANEHLTGDEKRAWKDCKWKKLRVELARARAAKRGLASRLKDIQRDSSFTIDGENEEEVEENMSDGDVDNDSMVGGDLDDEVVQTESRSWRDLKVGITGSPKAATRSSITGGESNGEAQKKPKSPPPPQSLFCVDVTSSTEEGADEHSGETS